MTPSSSQHSPLFVHGALILVGIIYGVFLIVVKWLMLEMHELEFALIRMIGAATIMLVLERCFYKTQFQSVADSAQLGIVGLLGMFVVQFLLVFGVNRTIVFHSGLLMALVPLVTLSLSLLFKREAFQWSRLFGIMLAFVGVGLLITQNSKTVALPDSYLLGDTLIILNAVVFSFYLLGTQPFLKKYPAFSVTTYCYVVSAALSLVVLGVGSAGLEGVPSFQSVWATLSHLSLQGWWLLGYVIILASIATYGLNNYALARTTPSTVSIYTFIQPLLAAILGSTLFHDPFTNAMAVAGGLTVMGVLIANGEALLSESSHLFRKLTNL
jgi:drug/metabolite transporter (DMT)-like permease